MKKTSFIQIPDFKYCRREGNIFIAKFSSVFSLILAAVSLAVTVPMTMHGLLPLMHAFAMSAALGCLFFSVLLCYMLLLKRREYKNMEILADTVDQPIEFRCPIIIRTENDSWHGYLFLTYDECHLITPDKTGIFCSVRDCKFDRIILKKSELFAACVRSEHRIDMLIAEGTGYQLSVFSLKGLVYLMDRDMWTLRGVTIASYT